MGRTSIFVWALSAGLLVGCDAAEDESVPDLEIVDLGDKADADHLLVLTKFPVFIARCELSSCRFKITLTSDYLDQTTPVVAMGDLDSIEALRAQPQDMPDSDKLQIEEAVFTDDARLEATATITLPRGDHYGLIFSPGLDYPVSVRAVVRVLPDLEAAQPLPKEWGGFGTEATVERGEQHAWAMPIGKPSDSERGTVEVELEALDITDLRMAAYYLCGPEGETFPLEQAHLDRGSQVLETDVECRKGSGQEWLYVEVDARYAMSDTVEYALTVTD